MSQEANLFVHYILSVWTHQLAPLHNRIAGFVCRVAENVFDATVKVYCVIKIMFNHHGSFHYACTFLVVNTPRNEHIFRKVILTTGDSFYGMNKQFIT